MDPRFPELGRAEARTEADSDGTVEASLDLSKAFFDLVSRAESGDQDALRALEDALAEFPVLARTVAGRTEVSLVENYAGRSPAAKEAVRRQLETIRKELSGSHPSPLERLLVERVVLTWLQVQSFETHYARKLRNLDLKQCEHYQRRIDRAHKRHLSAIRALAQVRKLLKPSVAQINIAEQQINTAGGCAP